MLGNAGIFFTIEKRDLKQGLADCKCCNQKDGRKPKRKGCSPIYFNPELSPGFFVPVHLCMAAFVYINSKDAIARLKKSFEELSKEQVGKSVGRAINSALRDTVVDMNRNVRAKYNIAAARVNDSFYIVKSNYTNLSGQIKIYASTVSMQEFNPQQVAGDVLTTRFGGRKNGAIASRKIQKAKPQGLSVEILKGETKTILSGYFATSAALNTRVVARGSYDHGFIFNAEERPRTLKGPSIYNMVMSGEIKEKANKFANDKFVVNLEREFNKRLKEMEAKSAV